MLETFLIDQGIMKVQRIRLLCIPDYLLFRTHPHKLYREFKEIPRYSIINRKVTEEIFFEMPNNGDCRLDTLYIVDGASALTNAPFFFPITKNLNLSVVGTNLDINELSKLRYTSITKTKFKKFTPFTIACSEVVHHSQEENCGLENKAVILPSSYNLIAQPKDIEWCDHTIAVGSVRDMNDFFPGSFDIMRINLGDFIEYNQRFPNTPNTKKNEKTRKQTALNGIEMVIQNFNISIVVISLYKIAKFFATSKEPILNQVQSICDQWGFDEALLINNEKRRVWNQEPMKNLENLYDAKGYIALFNNS